MEYNELVTTSHVSLAAAVRTVPIDCNVADASPQRRLSMRRARARAVIVTTTCEVLERIRGAMYRANAVIGRWRLERAADSCVEPESIDAILKEFIDQVGKMLRD